MLSIFRRMIMPVLVVSVVGGLWALATVKAELESPLPDTFRVDPALLQKALRAAYAPDSVAEADPRFTDFGWMPIPAVSRS